MTPSQKQVLLSRLDQELSTRLGSLKDLYQDAESSPSSDSTSPMPELPADLAPELPA
jgi:hypothetical protein